MATVTTSWTTLTSASPGATPITIQADPDNGANVHVRVEGQTTAGDYAVLQAGASIAFSAAEAAAGIEAQSASGSQTVRRIRRV